MNRCNLSWAIIRIVVTGAAALNLGSACAPPPPNANVGLPPETARLAFKSQCALNVITCTSSWPVALASVVPGPEQTVTPTETGFIVQGNGGNGTEPVYLVGEESTAGDGATQLFFSWSYAASDQDPQTLEAGIEFSTETNPIQEMQAGRHYIRLTVRNDIVRETVESDEFGVIAENVASYDFVELEIEVRD